MAEIHIIGQIVSACDFPKQSLFCKWNLQFGNNWLILSGANAGQTHVSNSEFYQNICYWNHPLDIHFATKGVLGWPKIQIQIYHLDWVGRTHLFGYGYLNVPTSPGFFELECFIWRPATSLKERISQYFFGGSPQLKYSDLVYSATERYKLRTETMGSVKLEIGVILRNFDKFGLQYK